MLDVDGVALELIDTAGLRETGNEIEREGVRRARAHLERADLALLVTDATHAQDDLALLNALPDITPRVIVVNKIDLDDTPSQMAVHDSVDWLWLSARTGAGLDALRTRLKHFAGADGDTGGAFSARRRHVLALERTAGHVDAAARVLAATRAGELAAEELHQAQQALGEITGAFCPDDLLGAIFSSFCIGK